MREAIASYLRALNFQEPFEGIDDAVGCEEETSKVFLPLSLQNEIEYCVKVTPRRA